jgi:hypothetical protein
LAQNPAAALQALLKLTDVVVDHLTRGEGEKAHAALTVLLMAALGSLGPESFAMKQFFPVLNAIKKHIDASDLGRALNQTHVFKAQLKEIIDIVQAGPLSSAQDSRPIDLSFRPKSYFWPMGLEVQLLTHIKGAARRAEVQRLIDAGQVDRIPGFLAKAELSNEERSNLGRIHPMFMGGEYLPDQETNEVEIARIEINSTTFDVTSVYARRDASVIHYRVVDEYDGATLTGPNTRQSGEPLTLGELEEFFMDAWPLQEVLENNFDADVDGMLGFFRATSEFYPDLDRLLRQRVMESHAAEDEEEDEDVPEDAG